MKKLDAIIILIIVVVAAALLVGSKLMPKTDLADKTADVTMAPDAIEYLDATAEPTTAPIVTDEPTAEPIEEAEPDIEIEAADAQNEAQEAAVFGPMPPSQSAEAKGHVVLTVGGRQYGDPIAMDRDKIITIRQEDGQINKVHITPEKVYMEDSTCDGQDCVGQGEVTLENYSTRILGAWILCLPNNVTIELVPAE